MARNLNLIHLIGNLTRNPELRYTERGRAVCTFGLATNRSWKTDAVEIQEESNFHRIVAWEKLAEQCAQLLVKGRKVYLQGRLGYRTYQKDDEEREVAEIVIDDMLLLDAKPTTLIRSTQLPPVPGTLDRSTEAGASVAVGEVQCRHVGRTRREG